MIATHQDRVQAQFEECQEMVNSVYDNPPNYHTDAFGSTAETCQFAMWAYAAYFCASFKLGYINGAKARSKERKIRIGALTARSFSSVISSQMFWVCRKSSLTLETIGDR